MSAERYYPFGDHVYGGDERRLVFALTHEADARVMAFVMNKAAKELDGGTPDEGETDVTKLKAQLLKLRAEHRRLEMLHSNQKDMIKRMRQHLEDIRKSATDAL